MKKNIYTLFFFLLVTQICFAQWKDTENNITDQTVNQLPLKLPHTTHNASLAPVSLHPSFYDRKADWQWIIDSTWGPGESLSGKRATFDVYQTFARAYNSTFLWNPINWDSLAASLYSKINDSTSRGGFARIIKDLSMGMIDGHAYAYDNVLLNTPLNPGTPILADGSGFINHFGAGLTPLADSSLLVYKVVPNHPLGLVPGDIILGYEGVPWSQIVRELFEGNVPHTLWVGATPSAYNRTFLFAAGESWHLFDTIDVVKYSTGLTEHLPLDPMVNLVAPSYIINNEQMPIPGVPMPLGYFPDHGAVTYGIIDGTNIGYIYVYSHVYQGVSSEFDAAVQALMQTDGLIIDIRVDWGGSYGLNAGISRLINYPTSTMDLRVRCNPNDLFSICPSNQGWWNGEIPADVGTYYDRPIAVLLGPMCVSYGDVSSWQFSYVPNAKMFGRSPAAVYSGMGNGTQPSRPGYSLQCPNLTLVDHYQPSLPRWGQEYPDLEDVWLTPDGVANGEDDVVNRALEWMNNLVYPHDILTDKIHYLPAEDTVQVTTVIENPNSHQLFARAYLHTVEGTLIDSVELVKQTVKTDGEDWKANFNLPSGKEFYKIGVTVFDETASDEYNASNATRFTTTEPVVLDSISLTKLSTFFYSVKPFIKNLSTVTTITNASVWLYCDDPWVISLNPTSLTLPNIPPGSIVSPSTEFIARVDTSIFSNYFNFKADIMSDGWVYWEDTLRVPQIVSVDEEITIQLSFKLEQNYPNPFNPCTKISWQSPMGCQQTLTIYDVLGNEVATLVDEYKPGGRYEIEFSAKGGSASGGNAFNLPSGVYFYQLKAGEFVQTRKMILIK